MDSRVENSKTEAAIEMDTTAVVLAAGQGKRMKSTTAKQLLPLNGKPVLYYSLRAFEQSAVDSVVLVCGQGQAEYMRKEIVELYGFQKVTRIVEGGRERYHSVHRGLQAVPLKPDREQYCLIHDGARPYLTQEIITRVLATVKQEKACVVGMPAKDTIKIADGEGYCAQTPARSLVWTVQTPQAFELKLIRQAYDRLLEQEQELLERGIQITDDAGVAELFTDIRVKLVEGSYENMKITTPEDMKIAEALLESYL